MHDGAVVSIKKHNMQERIFRSNSDGNRRLCALHHQALVLQEYDLLARIVACLHWGVHGNAIRVQLHPQVHLSHRCFRGRPSGGGHRIGERGLKLTDGNSSHWRLGRSTNRSGAQSRSKR